MNFFQKVLAFIAELYTRFFADTPRFFRILRNIGVTLTVVSGILIERKIAVPGWLEWLISTNSLATSIITAVLSQLVVSDPKETELPFTQKK